MLISIRKLIVQEYIKDREKSVILHDSRSFFNKDIRANNFILQDAQDHPN